MNPALIKALGDALVTDRLARASRIKSAAAAPPRRSGRSDRCLHQSESQAMKSSTLEPTLAVDRLLELYCEWRTTCWDVRTAYGRFCTVRACDRPLAYAAYQGALDREELVAGAYADQVSLASSLLERDSSASPAIASP